MTAPELHEREIMKHRKLFIVHRLPVIAAIMILSTLRCAQRIPPTGGPDDTTPPIVRESSPPQGETNVSTDARIVVVFSEWITPTRIQDAVTLFPPPEEGIDVAVSGKRLIVTPESPLLDSTTYHLGINTSLTDIRGVPIGGPVTIVFSTGNILDSAQIRGCIASPDPQKVQPKIGLYHFTEQWHDSLLLKVPTYLTQTDSMGRYSFDFIRPGSYKLAGFVDDDRNNRITAGREEGFMPTESLVVVDTVVGPIPLFPAVTDTAVVRIAPRSLTVRSPTVLRGRWTGSPIPSIPPGDTSWKIHTADGTAPSIDSYVSLGDESFLLLLSASLQNRAYTLVYPLVYPLFSPTETDTTRPLHDSLRFNGTAFPDTTAPTVIRSLPTGPAELVPQLSFIWSEPVRARESTALLIDTLGDTAIISIDTTFSDTTRMVPQSRLRPDRLYRLSIPPEQFVDLGGNIPKDTVDTFAIEMSVQTISADSLCYLLSGGAPSCLAFEPSRIWRYDPFSGESFYTADSSGLFSFDSIPASKGTLGYFEDQNGDRVPNTGRLFPWKAPELHVTFPDTVEARARWEITGVSFPDCHICPPPVRRTTETDTTAVDTGALPFENKPRP